MYQQYTFKIQNALKLIVVNMQRISINLTNHFNWHFWKPTLYGGKWKPLKMLSACYSR